MFIDKNELKRNIKITDLIISEGIEVFKKGNSYLCHCINPAHEDNIPSMSIKDSIHHFECFSCGIKGDIFNVLEYTRPNLYSFAERIQYLNDNYYLKKTHPIFSSLKASNKSNSIIKKNSDLQENKGYLNIMSYIAKYCVLKLTKEIKDKYLTNNKKIAYSIASGKEVIMNAYNLSDKIIEDFKIGYMPNSKKLYKELLEHYDKELIESVGLFDSIGMPIFKKRIIIPYIANGNPTYFVARQTEFTPKNEYEEAKYKNQKISNRYLYNEKDFDKSCVFIVEGAFDCLALKNIGYYCVAIGSINLPKKTIDKLTKGLKNSNIVYICFDNEINKAGNKQAELLNRILKTKGINSHLITIPLEEGEKKIDVNKYLGNHTKEDFNSLLSF